MNRVLLLSLFGLSHAYVPRRLQTVEDEAVQAPTPACGEAENKFLCVQSTACAWDKGIEACVLETSLSCAHFSNPSKCNERDGCAYYTAAGECVSDEDLPCAHFTKPSKCHERDGCAYHTSAGECVSDEDLLCPMRTKRWVCEDCPDCWWDKGASQCMTMIDVDVESYVFGTHTECPETTLRVTDALECASLAKKTSRVWNKHSDPAEGGVCTVIQGSPVNAEADGSMYFGPVGSTVELAQEHHKLVCFAAFEVQPGMGWCADASDGEGTARYFREEVATYADAETICLNDDRCVAFAWSNVSQEAVIYSDGDDCTGEDCVNNQWQQDPTLITKGHWCCGQTQWSQARCYVRRGTLPSTDILRRLADAMAL